MYALFWYSCGLWPPATTTQQASLAAATGCPPQRTTSRCKLLSFDARSWEMLKETLKKLAQWQEMQGRVIDDEFVKSMIGMSVLWNPSIAAANFQFRHRKWGLAASQPPYVRNWWDGTPRFWPFIRRFCLALRGTNADEWLSLAALLF